MLDEDELVLTTVGVDIGSATSHLMFARIVMERQEDRYEVVSRSQIAASQIFPTPFVDAETIDQEILAAYIDQSFLESGVDRGTVDTGSLLLTGLAMRRANARLIGEVFANESGRFVTVAAGDALESMLAAYGSGAVAASSHDERPLINVDVGGGTTKIALCHRGSIVAVTALNVGARLITMNEDRCVQVVEAAGAQAARLVDVAVQPGRALTCGDAERIAAILASEVVMAALDRTGSPGPFQVIRPLLGPPANRAMFSGGVSEYLYGRQKAEYGDLGLALARSLRQKFEESGFEILPSGSAGIRATVVGASQYTTQVSGSTVYIDPPEAVPVRNVAVIDPLQSIDAFPPDVAGLASALVEGIATSGVDPTRSAIAVMLRWRGSVDFESVDRVCRALVMARRSTGGTHPLMIACDRDVAGLLGLHLRDELGFGDPIISIDGLNLLSFDYIDIGEFVDSSGAVPVTIKSLVFPATDAAAKSAAGS